MFWESGVSALQSVAGSISQDEEDLQACEGFVLSSIVDQAVPFL